MPRSTETPKLPEISSEQSVLSQEGARACVEDLPESVNMRLKLSISPVSSVSGGTFFSPLFIIILRLIWKVMIKCCQKAYRRGGKASIIVFWHFWHQRFLWRKEKKETKQNLFSQDSSAFCFLWLRKIRLQRGWCYRTKACLPSRSLSELCFHLKAIFTEICSPVKWVFTL